MILFKKILQQCKRIYYVTKHKFNMFHFLVKMYNLDIEPSYTSFKNHLGSKWPHENNL